MGTPGSATVGRPSSPGEGETPRVARTHMEGPLAGSADGLLSFSLEHRGSRKRLRLGLMGRTQAIVGPFDEGEHLW